MSIAPPFSWTWPCAQVSELMVWFWPFRSNILPLSMYMLLPVGSRLAPPANCTVPSLIQVVPLNVLAPLRTNVPVPTLTRLPAVEWEMTPLMVSVVPGSTPTLWLPPPPCSTTLPPQALLPLTLRKDGVTEAPASPDR